MNSLISQQPITVPFSGGIATTSDIAHSAFGGFERVVELNMQAIKATLVEQHAIADAAISSRSPIEIFDLNVETWRATTEKAGAYMRHVGEIVAQTQGEIFAIAARQFPASDEQY